MKEKTLNEVLTELQESLENDDLAGAIKLLEALRPADQADLVEGLDTPDQVALLSSLSSANSAASSSSISSSTSADSMGCRRENRAI